MLKLFWKRMDEAAEGVGVGGGAGHEGGGWTERTEKHGVALGERVDEQQATGDDWDVEEQEGGAAGQDFGIGVQQQEGGAAAQEGGVRGQQQEGVVAAQEGGAGGQEQEGEEAAQERFVAVRRRYRTASGSGQAGPSTTCHSTSAIASGGQVVELLQRVAEVEASQKKLVADVFAKHIPPSSVGGHVDSLVASPPSRARQTVGKSVEDKDVIVLGQSPREQTSEAAPKPPPNTFSPLRDMLQGLGKKGGKGVVAGEKSGAPIGQVASAGKGAVEKRGAPTPSSSAAGKGAGEKRGAPSEVAVAARLLSKTKADSPAQLGIAGRPVEPVGKRPSSVLGDASLSEPGSPPPGPRPRPPSASKKRQAVTKSTKRAAEATESSDVKMASTVVAARHENSKKPKVIGYTPPPLPDNQGKTRGCKAPFKGPGMMSRKGKPVSEQTVGSRKRFLGTFETEADQKFCTAICWRVYFPDIDLKEYEGFMAQDEKDWKVYLDAAARMPTGVWSVAQEQGECRFDE
ncbi:unnamed protein product [Closterium sp. Naga37s-1]|nr:unnamed protein product [Closterium sp. Naga37s-1]